MCSFPSFRFVSFRLLSTTAEMERSEMTVVHPALNGIDYLFSNFSLHKEHKESRIPTNPFVSFVPLYEI